MRGIHREEKREWGERWCEKTRKTKTGSLLGQKCTLRGRKLMTSSEA